MRYRDKQSNANGQAATIGFQGAGGASAKAYPLTCNGKILDDNDETKDGWSIHPKAIAMSPHSVLAFSPDDVDSIPGLQTFSGDDQVQTATMPFSITLDGVSLQHGGHLDERLARVRRQHVGQQRTQQRPACRPPRTRTRSSPRSGTTW